jgi:hypothetical protein
MIHVSTAFFQTSEFQSANKTNTRSEKKALCFSSCDVYTQHSSQTSFESAERSRTPQINLSEIAHHWAEQKKDRTHRTAHTSRKCDRRGAKKSNTTRPEARAFKQRFPCRQLHSQMANFTHHCHYAP